MTDTFSTKQSHPMMWLLWLLIFVGLPFAIAAWETRPRLTNGSPRLEAMAAAQRLRKPATAPPAVEPVQLYSLDRDQAQALNATTPFSHLPNPAARAFIFHGSETDLARAVDCLAAAQLYEAGDEAVGEQAVAQVVLNRVRHPAFPKTVCGVVFQGQERATGCQFTFTCDGALARIPSDAAWARARDIARSALAGKVYRPVGYATHYHTDWVVPYWSGSLDKIAAVGTHLFFRWRGWWGTPPAFRLATQYGEPTIPRIAQLSAIHRAGASPVNPAGLLAGGTLAELTGRPQEAIGTDSVGKTMAGVRLVAIAPGAKGFIIELGHGSSPDNWPLAAQTFCAGRPECRIMAWRAGSSPAGFPLGSDDLENMAFAYIHNADTGLQKSLWNCFQSPRTNREECMRDRLPRVAPAQASAPQPPPLEGVRRKERFETVKIVPPVAPVVAVKP